MFGQRRESRADDGGNSEIAARRQLDDFIVRSAPAKTGPRAADRANYEIVELAPRRDLGISAVGAKIGAAAFGSEMR